MDLNLRPPVAPSLFPVPLKRDIEWVDDGAGGLMPRPVNVPLIDSKSANQLVSVAMSLPYKGKYVTKKIVEKNESGSETYDVEEFQPVEQHEPELAGMSQIEVAMIRLARLASGGNPAALEQILDRILGKPITKGMSMSTDLPYEKYLEMVANQENNL